MCSIVQLCVCVCVCVCVLLKINLMRKVQYRVKLFSLDHFIARRIAVVVRGSAAVQNGYNLQGTRPCAGGIDDPGSNRNGNHARKGRHSVDQRLQHSASLWRRNLELVCFVPSDGTRHDCPPLNAIEYHSQGGRPR